jgi:hypothetical protein
MKSKRKFDSTLFHGNGDYSEAEYYLLQQRLEYGHSLSSGLQQGIVVSSPEYKEGMEEIKDVCRDILASFGFTDKGLEWEKAPYPGLIKHQEFKIDEKVLSYLLKYVKFLKNIEANKQHFEKATCIRDIEKALINLNLKYEK